MHKNNDIILISETHSEYIDKIIVILNDRKKDLIPKDIIIKQAENIIFEYQKKGFNGSKSSVKSAKLFFFASVCFMFGTVIYLTAKLLI